MRALLPLAIGLSLLLASCGGTSAPSESSPSGASGAGGEGSGGDTGQGGSGGGVNLGGSGGINVGGATGKPVEAEVYSHSASTLYKLDPKTKQVTEIGVFDCVKPDGLGGGMWDIALDKDNAMFGTSNKSLVKIDPTNAKCQILYAGSQSFPNALTFVPAGVLDPNEEVLVGYNQSTYVRIDKASGKMTDIGGLNPNSTGQNWESSGDIVSIIGGKTYLTAKTDFGVGPDTLLEVDPKTGKALKVVGKVLLTEVWGLAFWGGKIYGFNNGGQAVELDLVTGKGGVVPGLPSNLSFWGAGVTTSAPLEPID